MTVLYQVGGLLIAGFVFIATIAAMSRLLKMPEVPSYITYVTDGISNLFTGALGK